MISFMHDRARVGGEAGRGVGWVGGLDSTPTPPLRLLLW